MRFMVAAAVEAANKLRRGFMAGRFGFFLTVAKQRVTVNQT
jgi:hypothetical protein